MTTPLDTINKLVEAFERQDVDAAISLYEPQAVIVAQPGQIASGTAAVRKALEGFISLKPKLKTISHQLVEAGDIALYCSKWTLTGTAPDGKRVEMSGMSSDVLRRQPDGRWLVAVDNPWGTSIIG
jgi:uncharacterized protein (TIGR02246 family)